MAQNLIIAGATYSDVPAIDMPKAGGGTVRFVEQTPPVQDATTKILTIS